MLISQGLITPGQLKEALILQESKPEKKLGELLIELNYLTINDFQNILHLQIENLGIDMEQDPTMQS
jgi:hypothetical protein